MAFKETWIATIQVLLEPGQAETQVDACDFLSSLLSENDGVLDWQYLPVNGQHPPPTKILLPEQYEEGEAFS